MELDCSYCQSFDFDRLSSSYYLLLSLLTWALLIQTLAAFLRSRLY
jgi:hypothetical protein